MLLNILQQGKIYKVAGKEAEDALKNAIVDLAFSLDDMDVDDGSVTEAYAYNYKGVMYDADFVLAKASEAYPLEVCKHVNEHASVMYLDDGIYALIEPFGKQLRACVVDFNNILVHVDFLETVLLSEFIYTRVHDKVVLSRNDFDFETMAKFITAAQTEAKNTTLLAYSR